MGDRLLGRQPALNQPRRRSGLHDDVLASLAGVFGLADDEHPKLGWRDVELLVHVLADPAQLAFAARTGLALDVYDRLDTRQVSGQAATIGAPLARALGRSAGDLDSPNAAASASPCSTSSSKSISEQPNIRTIG
jgi:hypothetical protein